VVRRGAVINERGISVTKTTMKRSNAKSRASARPTRPSKRKVGRTRPESANPGSKQSRVIAMLQSHQGVTIGAMMKATGWQQHSVRGFLAGVVRKRLKLKLRSKKTDVGRVYQITGGNADAATARHSSSCAA
jgi:hypothetical protein